MLAGVRILSLTSFWAGPSAVRLLTDMGAEAIKIEATKRPDPSRGPKAGNPNRREYPGDQLGPDAWNRVPRFNERHLGSQSLTLDLSSPRGREIFLELVKISDVVVENFSARVMGSLGIDYAVLKSIKPDIIMLSMPGFGVGGPWQDFISFGPTLEYIAGLAALTGYEPGDARLSGVLIPDFMASFHGAAAILAGLHHRQETGEGRHIELAQLESTLCLVGERLLEAEMRGTAPEAQGNQHPIYAPHGCFQCKGSVAGEEAWVTIAVTSEVEWKALCAAAKRNDLAGDSRFFTMADRKNNEQALNSLIGDWTSSLDKYQITYLLQCAGIPAAPVLTARDHFGDPQVLQRQMLIAVDHPSCGVRMYPGNTWKSSLDAPVVPGPAPMLGQHNHPILKTLLGMGEDQVKALEQAHIIGTEPV